MLEPETSDETILRDTGNSSKTLPCLKADPRFVDIHFHGSTFTHRLQKAAVELFVSGVIFGSGTLDQTQQRMK